ncbi:hypothetical protein DN062_14800 [Nitrincola tibetensis]|uniref:Lipoprotein LPP20-like domain-containing protein n=1 Tax=Nitrincola tibetensis TaxID=2219697 RepID=A0A364NJG2_9GAMM|nr:LPP20 family lipoprotein [Nitrincola tibetensis]RAU17171.1 hypothetical protein DN062_14800 [Nitrincola tibetensis]
MTNKLKLLLSALALSTLAGCAYQAPGCRTTACGDMIGSSDLTASSCVKSSRCDQLVIPDEQVLNVVGYGAPRNTFESAPQRRLMALRASEVDAYRKMAEQVSGVHIFGDTSVDNFVANHDRLRTRLNSFIQGATITHQEFQDDGVAITYMALKISRSELRRLLESERLYHTRGHGLIQGGAYRDTLYYAPRY